MVCVSPLYRKSGDFALEFLGVHKEFYLFSHRMRVAYYYTLKGGVHHVFVQQGCYDRFFFFGELCTRLFFLLFARVCLYTSHRVDIYVMCTLVHLCASMCHIDAYSQVMYTCASM